MSEHLRDRLHQEMSGELPAPDRDLVAGAVTSGLRSRRVRRTASGAGTFAVVGLTVLAVTIGSQLGSGPATVAGQAGSAATTHADSQLAAAAPVKANVVTAAAVASSAAPVSSAAAPVTTAAAPVTTAAPTLGTVGDKLAAAKAWHTLQNAASAANPPQWTAAPAGVAATPKGELQLFSELAAPYGKAHTLAVSEDADDQTHVSARLTNAAGQTGSLQFSLEHDTLGQAGDCAKPAPNDITCHATSDGGYAIVANDHGGCVNTADLTYVHPDGTAVHVFLASCLKDNATNIQTQGTQTLSAADAEAIFTNPGFDFTMPAGVVDRGAQNIGTLATFW